MAWRLTGWSWRWLGTPSSCRWACFILLSTDSCVQKRCSGAKVLCLGFLLWSHKEHLLQGERQGWDMVTTHSPNVVIIRPPESGPISLAWGSSTQLCCPRGGFVQQQAGQGHGVHHLQREAQLHGHGYHYGLKVSIGPYYCALFAFEAWFGYCVLPFVGPGWFLRSRRISHPPSTSAPS